MVLAPGFLLGALAIALPLILHFLRRQPTEVVSFPTLVFLVKSLKKQARLNSIRRWLVLLARCAVFALLALAFARPFFSQPFASASTALMIVLDNSYSMGASAQFEQSKAAALQALQQLHPGDQAGLILANSRAQLAQALSVNTDAVRSALQSAQLSSAANDYDGALRLADAQLDASPCGKKRLGVFGDNQELAWQSVDFSRPLSPGVELITAPTSPRQIDDAGVDDVKISAPFTAANQKLSAQIKIHNYSETAEQKRTVHLEIEGKEAATLGLTLRPGEIADRVIEFSAGALQSTRGLVKLDADAFPINDTRYFALNPETPLRVGIWPPAAEGEVDLLQVALAPSPDLATVDPVSITSPADINSCTVLVLRPGDTSDPALTDALVAAIQQGKPALIFADDSHAAQIWLRELGVESAQRHSSDDPLHLGGIDFNSPVVALFAQPGNGDLFGIRFTNPPNVQPPANSKIIASFDDGTPALIEMSAGKGEVLLVASGLDRASTSWPLQSTFLPFVQESLKHLVAREPQISQVLVGNPLPGDHPGATSDEPGIVSTTLNGKPWLVAVNVDPAESDLTPWTNQLQIDRLSSGKARKPSAGALATLHGEEAERHQRDWWYLLLATAAILIVEIFLANRTTL